MGHPEHLKHSAQELEKESKEVAKSKVEHLVQRTALDIPVFPYGYRDGVNVPEWVGTPRGVGREAFIAENLSFDWLPATANKAQYKNLYGQLHQHAYSIGAHILKCSREYKVSLEIVQNGKIIPEVKNIGTPVTSYIDEDMKDTYHFIRVWDSSEQGRFIDFLRENATGYVLAWRVFATLAQAGAARLCYFTDEKAIALKLADLFMFDITNQHSSYSVAKRVKFGTDSMVNATDLLAKVHANPGLEENYKTRVAVHFFLFVFGEAPRSDIFKRRMYQTIFSQTEEETDEVGDIYQVCANSWNNSSKTTCLVNLLTLEMKMAADLKAERPNKVNPRDPHPSLVEFLEEMEIHKRIAQERCCWFAGQDIQDVYQLKKQLVDGKYIYAEVAYKRLAERCISLLKYSELVTGVIMREKPYDKPLYLKGYSSKESERPVVDESDLFKKFESFQKAHKKDTTERRNVLLLKFLPQSIRFLIRWGYTTHVESAMSMEEIKFCCNDFVTKQRSGMSEDDAAKAVMRDWVVKRGGKAQLQNAVTDLMKFIRANRLVDPVE